MAVVVAPSGHSSPPRVEFHAARRMGAWTGASATPGDSVVRLERCNDGSTQHSRRRERIRPRPAAVHMHDLADLRAPVATGRLIVHALAERDQRDPYQSVACPHVLKTAREGHGGFRKAYTLTWLRPRALQEQNRRQGVDFP